MSTKKCAVLDLDNTLWGGIIGEDGIDGIKLSLEEPGASFVAFQQALLDLYDRGIILAVNSRNNWNDAMKVIESHPNMILKNNHFAALRINWQDKALNLKELAEELNIGLDSMVFLDDDPTNRAVVRAMLPEVETPDLPIDPREYARFLRDLPYFVAGAITDEDKMRGNLYVTERLRREAEKAFPNQSDFLKSLGLELEVSINDESSITRLSQLTEKTNQFNTHKVPLDENQMFSLMRNSDYRVVHGRLTDRFGDYGIVNLAILKKDGKKAIIEQYLMSCRVIGRGIEEVFLRTLGQVANGFGSESFSINFASTEKNAPAREFVENQFHDKIVDIKDLQSPEHVKIVWKN